MTFHKFGAVKTIVDGKSFSSKLEASVYGILRLREKAGEVRNVRLQQNVRLKEKCEACGDGPLDFTVDFSYETALGETVYVEAKGVRASSYIKREKAWMRNPPAVLEVWGGSWKSPKLLKVIEKKR